MNEIDHEISRCHVLVVEDDVGIQQLLIGSFLEEMNIADVTYAENGVEGLARARERLPDLVVLDIEMPLMNGLEMLRHLRADPNLSAIPVIIQTSHDSPQQREQMFLAGATDFVLKPLNGLEFQARLRVHLENLLHLRRLSSDLSRMNEELTDAAQLQRALLPNAAHLAAIHKTHGVGIDFMFEPSSKLGGDFWGLIPIDQASFAIYICDFAGHGVSAAMNTFQLHVLLNGMILTDKRDPAGFVREINRGLFGSLRQRQYATFFLGVVDLADGVIRYCSCGCPDPLLGSRIPGSLTRLDGSGIPLGALPEVDCENREIAFPVGTALFLYSDALSEPVDIDGRVLAGLENACFAMIADSLPFERGIMAMAMSRTWVDDRPLSDDLTAIWLERLA